MIDGRTVLALIPARGGSKGVPRKNIRLLADKPLITWSIEAARASHYVDRLVLSSDDDDVRKVAQAWDCEVLERPEHLARDDTPGIAPVLHAISQLDAYDYVVLLQPTSPFRTTADIDACIAACHHNGWKVCVAVVAQTKSPYWLYFLEAGRLEPFLAEDATVQRRQDSPELYALSGAVYVAECAWLEDSKSFLTPETHGYPLPALHSLDIDSEDDFTLAEALKRYQLGRSNAEPTLTAAGSNLAPRQRPVAETRHDD